MLETKIDLLKNRLYITLGRVRKDKVADSAKKIEVEIHKLEPGFTCITRIIDVREIDANDVRAIIEIQDLLSEHGMSKAVRVGDDSGKELLDRIGQDVSYIALSADTLEEAEQILDEWESSEKRE
jgi:PP-loop superfamily ATP-utilizing enzyme